MRPIVMTNAAHFERLERTLGHENLSKMPMVRTSVAATSDSGPPSRLGEIDSSQVESSHAHDFDRLLSRTQVDLS
jgi:hypothetical protein